MEPGGEAGWGGGAEESVTGAGQPLGQGGHGRKGKEQVAGVSLSRGRKALVLRESQGGI